MSNLPNHTVPMPEAKRRGRRMGSVYDDAPTILINENVLEQIFEFSEQDLRRETGGFLIGTASEKPRSHVEVRHFVPAVGARSKAASLTFTHDAWATMRREVDERFPDDAIVGWQHTHPNIGIFLSGYDMFIHRHFFSEPWQIALVVDPVKREFGFFQWRGEDVVDCGFVCLQAAGSDG